MYISYKITVYVTSIDEVNQWAISIGNNKKQLWEYMSLFTASPWYGKLTRSCKHLRLLCTPDPSHLPGVPYSVKFRAPKELWNLLGKTILSKRSFIWYGNASIEWFRNMSTIPGDAILIVYFSCLGNGLLSTDTNISAYLTFIKFCVLSFYKICLPISSINFQEVQLITISCS